ncbi:MAG: VOC family protein [Betaproteobacteria bacterium]|nr:VOC family protein [Betaproteobacteria bacterium]
MAKLRHIAFSVPDPWATAEFYMQAFGMTKVGETDSPLARGVYLTDGTINLAILNYKNDEMAGKVGKDFVGIHHLGFWVDDIEASKSQASKAGATYWMGEVPSEEEGNNFYEVKYRDPDGIVFDLSANGWGGAVRDVVPASESRKIKVPELVADRTGIQKMVA